jgi:hypothetical protein
MTRTEQEIKDKIAKLITNSGIKRGSKQAAILEQGFLFGFMFANEEENATAYLQITILSGRSILDFP